MDCRSQVAIDMKRQANIDAEKQRALDTARAILDKQNNLRSLAETASSDAIDPSRVAVEVICRALLDIKEGKCSRSDLKSAYEMLFVPGNGVLALWCQHLAEYQPEHIVAKMNEQQPWEYFADHRALCPIATKLTESRARCVVMWESKAVWISDLWLVYCSQTLQEEGLSRREAVREAVILWMEAKKTAGQRQGK